ncbi:hypothetical protein TGCAST_305610A, partial [Toxoplasma gondii CAST]
MATTDGTECKRIIDPTPIDDEGVLTLIELDSQHPVIIAANTQIQQLLLAAVNKLNAEAAALEDRSRLSEESSEKSLEDEQVFNAAALLVSDDREKLCDQMKQCRILLDACNRVVVDLDSIDFSAMKVIWGDERSVRQSRKHLTQLVERMSDCLEKTHLFFKSVFGRLPELAPSPTASAAESSLPVAGVAASSATEGELPEKEESERTAEARGTWVAGDLADAHAPGAGRGCGRGEAFLGAGRGRGLVAGRGRGVAGPAGRGGGFGPGESSSEDEAGRVPAASGDPQAASRASPSSEPPAGEEGEADGERTETAGRKHPRADAEEPGVDKWGNRRWKRKPVAHVDWLLKCRTKLCELKERTVHKAISDVFIKER